MAITDSINKTISKTTDVVGAGAALANLPGVPQGIKDSINSIFNAGKGLSASQNRRDLNNFLANTHKLNGFSRPSLFYVEIVPPKSMFGTAERDNAKSLAFLSESANLPGVSLATTDVRRYGYGPTERKPYAPIFVDTTITFLVDNKGVVQSFFYKWINSIVKFDTVVGGNGSVFNNRLINPFEVNYKDDYSSDIIITTVDDSNNDIVNVRYTKAFPIFMGDISLGWNDTDSVARLPITFTYYNWKIEAINLNQISENRKPGVIQSLIKAGTAIQTLATLRKPRNVADVLNVVNNSKIAIGGLF